MTADSVTKVEPEKTEEGKDVESGQNEVSPLSQSTGEWDD